MTSDPFGRAIRDFHRGEQEEPLVTRHGGETMEHPIEAFYFGAFEGADWATHLRGPLLDVGAGVGRHSLHFQEAYETVAIEVSEPLVETMRERGVRDARLGDMFALRGAFERDRFGSALLVGTQLCLCPSMDGLREFLSDLAYVTDPEGTAVVDAYDPDHPVSGELLGFRDDPAPGLGHRVFHFEYGDEVGEPLVFRLFSPERLREATIGTDWAVAEVVRDPEGSHYRAVLTKS